MDKKSVIRFASLMTAVLISASSLPRLCATVSAEQATDPVTAAAGEASLVSYKTYAADMTDRKSAEKSITLSSDAARVYGGAALKSVNGKDAVVFSKSSCGAEWKFTVPEDAQAGDIFVVNLEVQDAGVERPMTRFAQVVITVEA